MTVRVLLLLALVLKVYSIWPPPHEINLEDSETFVISEFSESDALLNDEDEMIPVEQSSNREKYHKIHQMALRYNKRALEENKGSRRNITRIKEHNFDLDEPIPWEGGFVDKSGTFIQPDNENVYYLNEMAKSLIDSKIEQKREDAEDKPPENYDYSNLKVEYQAEVEKAKKDNNTYNYTEVKEDESFVEAMEKVVEIEEAKNCTAEEKKGIGIAAFKCILTDVQKSKSQKSILKLMEKILWIALIWFCIYAAIAIPCWCTRGWCCCCCCCRICRPRQTIDEAKRFFTLNPVGVFHTKSGEKVEYEPTTYEIYTQRQLEKALFNL